MATETYKWFRPDPNLRAAYGGGAALNAGDSREVDIKALTHRWVCKQLGIPTGATRYLWEVGTATDTFLWIRVPDLFYAAISPHLSAAELATVVSTVPAGWTKASVVSILQPNPMRKTIIKRGDSIGAGASTTTGDTRDTWMGQVFSAIPGEPIVWLDGNYSEGVTKTYQVMNLSLGSSNWDNSIALGLDEEAYPKRESLAYAQRVQTLPLFGRSVAFLYALGTNDIAYDAAVTGADAWARAVIRLSAFQAEFPTIKLGIETLIRRSESSTLNTRLGDYNALVRANYASMGLELFDTDALVPEMNVVTGDTTNLTYYNADGVHPKTAGNTLVATAHNAHIIAWLAAA